MLKRDGSLDVRVAAVLSALQDLASSGGGGQAAAGVQQLLRQLLVQRCEQLLSGFGSSVQDDDAWLQRGDSSSDWDATPGLSELMCAVVQYRRGKKLVLNGAGVRRALAGHRRRSLDRQRVPSAHCRDAEKKKATL